MNVSRDLRSWSTWAALLAGLLLSRCDSIVPVEEGLLVVECFLGAEKPLPEVVLRRAHSLGVPYPDDATTAVADAEVTLDVDGERIPYRPVPSLPGRYAPGIDPAKTVPSRARFGLDVQWGAQHATAEGRVPPPIAIDSIRVAVPEEPVQAVLLDSLRLDSLGTGVREGFIYPIEVTLWWTTDFDDVTTDTLYWVRAQLKPFTTFSSTIIDFFLRPGQILRERTLPRDALNRRHWTGVYAVPVDEKTDPLPAHRLRVALLRSGQDYARYAASRDAPERREPVSNVQGAIGIVAGISVDSLQVQVGR